MLTKVTLLCFVACVAVQAQPPSPYNFAYEHVDEKTGAKVTQSESGDANNVKTGSYGINDPTGIYRLVQYIADAQGFRVTVDTNEHGTKTHDAANARYNSKAANAPVPAVPVFKRAVVSPARFTPVTTVQAVRAAPVSLHAIPVTVHALHAVPVVHAVHTRQTAISPSYIHFTLGRARRSV